MARARSISCSVEIVQETKDFRKVIGRYRTKPCEIEAIQWVHDNTKEVIEFCEGNAEYFINDAAWQVHKAPPVEGLKIHTLEGDIYASINDYIIKGLKGEFYPCKPDIFEKKYEFVKES